MVKLDLAEVCGDVQPELLWQESREAKSQLKCPTWVYKEVLNRGVSNAPPAAPLRRSIANSSPARYVRCACFGGCQFPIPVWGEQG